MHDGVAGDGGEDDEQPGAVVVATKREGEKPGAPPNPPLRLQLKGAERRRWVSVSGTSGVWRGWGCGGSFHPGALMAPGEVEGPGWRGGDGGVCDGWVWRDGRAGASQAG